MPVTIYITINKLNTTESPFPWPQRRPGGACGLAATVDSAGLEHFHRPKEFCWAGLEYSFIKPNYVFVLIFRNYLHSMFFS